MTVAAMALPTVGADGVVCTAGAKLMELAQARFHRHPLGRVAAGRDLDVPFAGRGALVGVIARHDQVIAGLTLSVASVAELFNGRVDVGVFLGARDGVVVVRCRESTGGECQKGDDFEGHDSERERERERCVDCVLFGLGN